MQYKRARSKKPSKVSKRSTYRRANELGLKLAEQIAASEPVDSVDTLTERSSNSRKVRSPIG